MLFLRKNILKQRFGKLRKEMLSPCACADTSTIPTPKRRNRFVQKALLLTLSASLTMEAAVTIPLFAAGMTAVLQIVNVYGAAARIGSALSQTGEELAIGAYAKEYAEEESPLPVALSAAYAEGMVRARAGKIGCIRHSSMVFSRFLEQDDRIDLVMTYQVQSPSGLIKIPGIVFAQHAAVRGWTGRKGSGGTGNDQGDTQEDHQHVYVTEYGRVYHTDPECSHIHLSIRQVTAEEANAKRNVYGEKYHACELCGGGGDHVYITTDGNRYHSSLSCSGLKRTVQEMDIHEAGELRPCSKCAGG